MTPDKSKHCEMEGIWSNQIQDETLLIFVFFKK